MSRLQRASYQSIANEVGFSKATVSLALNGHPSIPHQTRLKVIEVAEKQGYKIDSNLVRLMSYLRQIKKDKHTSVIALITDSPERSPWKTNAYAAATYTGLRTRAEELGYKLEEFWLNAEKGLNPRRLEQILTARGIEAVILSPLNTRSIIMDFSSFSVVNMGRVVKHPRTHMVDCDRFTAIINYGKALKAKGYRRIGLLLDHRTNLRTGNQFSGGFLAYQTLYAEKETLLPPLFFRHYEDSKVRDWINQYKPEVIFTSHLGLNETLAADHPRVKMVYLDWEKQQTVPGINQNREKRGAAAIDMINQLLCQNAVGLPKDIHIFSVPCSLEGLDSFKNKR